MDFLIGFLLGIIIGAMGYAILDVRDNRARINLLLCPWKK